MSDNKNTKVPKFIADIERTQGKAKAAKVLADIERAVAQAKAREDATKTLQEFDDIWAGLAAGGAPFLGAAERYGNGTGYFDDLAFYPAEVPMLFVDQDGRKGIILPLPVPAEKKAKTPHLNYVLFQRYSGAAARTAPIVSNTSGAYESILAGVIDLTSITFVKSMLQGVPPTDEIKAYYQERAANYCYPEVAPTYLKLLGMIS
jgi:hypothetical protein